MRPIAPEDKPLLAESFERLSEESRYRRFLTTKNALSRAELDYLVDVDHHDHEAIVALDPATGEGLGVARYIRSADDPQLAEVAVTVADDWQGRGLGRALLHRLTYRARREGVKRFSAVVLSENRASIGLLEGLGEARRRFDSGAVELVIELPAERGMGVRLARALRAAAGGSLIPAQALAHRVAGSSPRPPVQPGLPIRTIVVGADGSQTGAKTVAVAVRLGVILGATLHVVGARQARADAEQELAAATRAAGAEGLQAVTHARRGALARALIAVAEEQAADLLVVPGEAMSRTLRPLAGTVADRVSHHAPCSVLVVRPDST